MEVIVSSIIAFAGTNIDDIFVLTLFFGNNRYKTKEIIIGQYVGIIGLIALSLAGSLAGLFISANYIGLLGLIPVYLGVKGLINAFRKKDKEPDNEVTGNIRTNRHGNIFSVAAVTFANGGDNIGVYIPLFAALGITGKITMIFIFLCMIAMWCWAGKYLSKHPLVAKALQKYGHIVMPVILIVLGLYILYESGNLDFIVG